MIFQASMRRARVRPIHVFRCVIYAGDVALWAALAMLAIVVADVWSNGVIGSVWSDASGAVLTVSAALIVVATYRLALAYRHYLRFDHAIATAAASQIIVSLIALKFVFDWLRFL